MALEVYRSKKDPKTKKCCKVLDLSGNIEKNLNISNSCLKSIGLFLKSKSGITYSVDELKKAVEPFLTNNNITSYKQFLTFINESENYNKFIDSVTIKASGFFRNINSIEYIVKNVLCDYVKKYKQKPLNILVAGCSRGEEAYTLAILVDKYLPKESNVKITAIDLSPGVIKHAKEGIYTPDKLKNLPNDIIEKYFEVQKKGEGEIYYKVRENINKVDFKVHNLMESFPSEYGIFDVITCRNVMTWFGPKDKERLLSNLYNVLKPEGHLVLGKEPILENDMFSEIADSVFKKIS